MGNLTHTVSGGIASFRSAARVPIESLKCHFLPVLEGSGDPSPENVRPISGWLGCNIYKTGKNIGHITAYSATSGFPAVISNNYGTTLNTTTFSFPDTQLILTQSTWSTDYTATSYRNGYFNIFVDNLVFGLYYDISFKVTNITNPLNVNINLMYCTGPSGGGTKYPIVDGDTFIYKNVEYKPYTINNVIQEKYIGFSFRNCGMSFTLSEVMITPAGMNDGVWEPYRGEIIPITFPNINKNKLPIGTVSFTQYKKYVLDEPLPPGTYTISATVTSSDTDSNNLSLILFEYAGENEKSHIFKYLSRNTRNSQVLTIYRPCSAVYIYASTGYVESAGDTATWTDVLLEVGNSMTEYEPYNFDNIVYGGYIDVATGEIYLTWQYFDLYYYRNYFEWVLEWGVFWIDPNLRTGKPKKMFSSLSNIYPYGGQYNRMPDKTTGYIYYYDIAIRDDSFNGDLASFKASIQEGQYVVYELDTPIFVAKLSSLELQTFIDYNNILSNTNDITEVSYLIHDSNMIKERKLALISNNNQYYKKVIWNQLCPPLNADNWKDYSTIGLTSTTFNNGVATHEYLTENTGLYSVSICQKIIPTVQANHIYYASYMISPDHQMRYGLEFANNQYATNRYTVQAGEWLRCSFIAQCATTGYGNLYIPNVNPQDVQIGYKDLIKSPIYIDLTQMFGEGNEPPLREFEALCKFNHINLEEYHELNTTGIPQVWIMPKRKKIIWNQIAPYPSLTNYLPYDNLNTLTEENGILTITYGVKSRDYHNSIMDKTTIKYYQNHKYYVKQDFCPSWNSTGIGVSICNYGGLYYPQATANLYTTSSYILEKLTVDGYHNILLTYPYNENNLSIGNTCKVKNIILVDLTLMFGVGHEPTTVEEFEALCEKNYINLDFYQAQDSGTEQLWII